MCVFLVSFQVPSKCVFSLHWVPCPKVGSDEARGPTWALGLYQLQASTALLGHSFGCQSPLLLTANQPPASATPTLLWNHSSGQMGTCGFSACIRGSTVQSRSAIKDLGGFRGAASVSANNGLHCPMQDLP